MEYDGAEFWSVLSISSLICFGVKPLNGSI